MAYCSRYCGDTFAGYYHVWATQARIFKFVACAGTVSDVLQPSEAGWFTERFQIAAVKRYARLQAACTEQIYSGTSANSLTSAFARQSFLTCMS